MDKRGDDPGAGAANRVSKRNGAAIDIQLPWVEGKFPETGQHLSRECFIQFDESKFVERHSCLCNQFLDGRDWSDAHDLRIHPRRCVSDNSAHRLEMLLTD